MEEKKNGLSNVGDFLIAKGKWVVAFVLLICISVFVLVLLNVVDHQLNQKSQLVAESLENAYEAYLTAKNLKETKPVAFTNRTKELNDLLEKHRSASLKRYSGFRLSMIQAQLEKEKGNLLEAAAILAQCGRKNPHPLSPVLLMEAASLYENGEDLDKAFELLSFVVRRDKKSPFWARAVFNLGRIYEAKEDFSSAKSTYAKIADLESDEAATYAALAQSRLIALELPNEGDEKDAK